ncbi:unnamed protein product [Linum tenue]|uniref:Uncharacterized protein n=1 Tax=Linum tenue TaxID=586396 RepID=A0AAV0MFB7_9ROSI|nr:unnamed protein product [Linum tenue]
MGRRDSSPPKQDVPLAWNVRYRRGSRLGLRQGRVQAPRQLRQAEFPQPPHQGSHVEGKFEEYKSLHSSVDANSKRFARAWRRTTGKEGRRRNPRRQLQRRRLRRRPRRW